MKTFIISTALALFFLYQAMAAPVKNNIEGSLPPPVVIKILKSKSPAVLACYTSELKVGVKNKSGKILTHFEINGVGIVEKAEIKDSTLKNPKVEACVLEVLKKIKFPEQVVPDSRTKVTYPFSFSNSDKAAAKGKK